MSRPGLKNSTTSWEKISHWYDQNLGSKGDYYHQKIIIPQTLRLLNLSQDSSLVDLACGQGILARSLPASIRYLGLDISPSLIKTARQLDPNPNHKYQIADITKDLSLNPTFSHACIILAFQNLAKPFALVRNAASLLLPQGKLLLVLNHPCFRLPQHSDWGFDSTRHVQYRRLDRYLSSFSVGIASHPHHHLEENQETPSFHHSLSAIFEMLTDNGFAITKLEEWVSDKKSTGGRAHAENFARFEFPLFLSLLCQKN